MRVQSGIESKQKIKIIQSKRNVNYSNVAREPSSASRAKYIKLDCLANEIVANPLLLLVITVKWDLQQNIVVVGCSVQAASQPAMASFRILTLIFHSL